MVASGRSGDRAGRADLAGMCAAYEPERAELARDAPARTRTIRRRQAIDPTPTWSAGWVRLRLESDEPTQRGGSDMARTRPG
jgi:hypothetical protein